MRLRRVISGGQTGADRMGLWCAARLGIETGGTVPRGCRTDEGPDPALVTEFGCVEHASPNYPPRTAQNVKDSDATVWFGNVNSPGGRLTRKLCVNIYNKPFIIVMRPHDFYLAAQQYAVINVAGNRRRSNPGVVRMVCDAFDTLKQDVLR